MCMCVKQLEALRVSGMLALACWEKINGPWYILSWWKSVCQHDTTCAGECDRLSTHYTLVCVGGMGLRNYVCTSVCTVHMSRSVHRWKKVSRCFSTEHGTSCAYFKSSVHKYKIKKINHLSQSLIWITNVRLKKNRKGFSLLISGLVCTHIHEYLRSDFVASNNEGHFPAPGVNEGGPRGINGQILSVTCAHPQGRVFKRLPCKL